MRLSLYDIFGEDASPKVNKFLKVILNKLEHGNGRILGLVGSLAQEFLKLDSNDGGGYAKPAMETKVERKYEAYVGSSSMKPRLSKRRNFDEWLLDRPNISKCKSY